MFEAVPGELKALRQWIVWRSVPRDGKITKPPYSPHTQNPASVTDPSHWGTYEEAIACYNANASVYSGIGFVFTTGDVYFGIDIDAEDKVAEEDREARRLLCDEVLKRTGTYAERSPSGSGLHLIGRGRLPGLGRRSTKMQIEIYQAERYFTMTGQVWNNRTEIQDAQEVADYLSAGWEEQKPIPVNIGDVEIYRRLDLTDEDVLREACIRTEFAPRYNAQVDCQPGKWSDTFIYIVGQLDCVTGKVDQLRRLVMNSPMVQSAPPATSGESRIAKAERNFFEVLSKVRVNNTNTLHHVDRGRKFVDSLERTKAERAKEEVKRILEKAESAFSRNGIEILKAFPIPPRYLELTAPPGVVGEYVQAAMDAMFNPFLKFALPATLASLSGIIARGYKIANKHGAGVNFNIILAAETATGKTQSMGVWEQFQAEAIKEIPNTLQGQALPRIINASAASIQGIFEDFMATPSGAWFISECSSQLQAMSSPKSSTDGQLRDAYNDLYDASRTGRRFSPPRSVANRKANLIPIDNLSISTYWTTTISKFDIFVSDARDGFLSRVIIIRHAGRAGDPVPPLEVVSHLPEHLHNRLVERLAVAKHFDEVYPLDGDSRIVPISTDGIEAERWAYQQIAERIKNASLDGTLPLAYTTVSRLPQTALRVAGVLAVMDNPNSPSITQDQYEWAFGYVLQNAVGLLSDLDTGQLGASMSEDVTVVIREMKKLMRKLKANEGVKKSVLADHLKRIKPFVDQYSPGDAIRKTLLEMQETDLLTTVTIQHNGAGRPALLICPTGDEAWNMH